MIWSCGDFDVSLWYKIGKGKTLEYSLRPTHMGSC